MADRSCRCRPIGLALKTTSPIALGAALLVGATPALAQQTTPGVSPNCPIAAGVANCAGVLAGGVVSNPGNPAFDVLNIDPTGPIAPPGYFAIGVVRSDRDIDINIADGAVINTFDDPGIGGVAQGLIAVLGGGFDLAIDSGAAITANGNGSFALGIEAVVQGGAGDLSMTNRGAVTAFTSFESAVALQGRQEGSAGAIAIVNSGALSATSGGTGERSLVTAGILARHDSGGGDIAITNSGAIMVLATTTDTDFTGIAAGIVSNSFIGANETSIVNSGAMTSTGQAVHGIVGFTSNDSTTQTANLNIENSGTLSIDGVDNYGVLAQSAGTRVNTAVQNSAAITMANGANSNGLFVLARATTAALNLSNEGDITGTGSLLRGLGLSTFNAPPGGTYDMLLFNDGAITLDAAQALGMTVFATREDNTAVDLVNLGDLDLSAATNDLSNGISVNLNAVDANAGGAVGSSRLALFNGGDITMGAGRALFLIADDITAENAGAITIANTNGGVALGIDAAANNGGAVSITNSGTIDVSTTGQGAIAVQARVEDEPLGSVLIANSGAIDVSSGDAGERTALTAGLHGFNELGDDTTPLETNGSTLTIDNSGDISVTTAAGSFAPDVDMMAGAIVARAMGEATDTIVINRGALSVSGPQTSGIVTFGENASPGGTARAGVENYGNINVTGNGSHGIYAQTAGMGFASIDVLNYEADISLDGAGGTATGLFGRSGSPGALVYLTNIGSAITGSGDELTGIGMTSEDAPAGGTYLVDLFNDADSAIALDAPLAYGMSAALGPHDLAGVSIDNYGMIDLSSTTAAGSSGIAISATNIDYAAGAELRAFVTNGGDITIGTGTGIRVTDFTRLTLTNAGSITTTGPDSDGIVIDAGSSDDQAQFANSGAISSALGRAIVTESATNLVNSGSLAGGSGVAALLSGADDRFELQVGGTVTGRIEAGGGSDVFALGGIGAASFDFGLVGSQYNAFEAFEKVGASDWALTGSNAVAAPLTIRQGVLRANGTFANLDIAVLAGTMLAGAGMIGDVTVTGGTLAPGNSIGTLTVGNLSLDAASTLVIEADAMGNSDRIVANGTVALGGATLSILGIDAPSFSATNQYVYTIVANDGTDAVGGTFGTILSDLAFLDTSVEYAGSDGNDVVLTLGQARVFPDVAATFNQSEAASALARFDTGAGSDSEAVYMDILFLSADGARAAFDAASGEIYAALLGNAAGAGAGRADRMILRNHELSGEGWGIWGSAGLRDAARDSDGNAARVNADGFDFALGIDYRGVGNAWAFGAAFGYVDGDLAVTARNARAGLDGWNIGIYGRLGTGNAGITASAAADYGNVDARTTRSIAFGAIARTATGTAGLETFVLAGELRYGLALGGGWAAGPVASIRYADADLGSLSESGANSLNLAVGGGSEGSTRLGGGLFVNWSGTRGSVDLGAQYVDGDGGFAEVPLTFAGAAGQRFLVRSPRTQGEAALLSLAGRHDLGGGWSLGGHARAILGRAEQEFGGGMTLAWRF